jgi:hypothetical protein
MTERKPAGVRFESWIESQIRAAERAGDFDDLPGKGRPDPNLELGGDPLWWTKKLMKREGVGVLPPALELRREVEVMREELTKLKGEGLVRERIRRLNERIRRVNSTSISGPPTTVAPLDEEALVERWRESRG